MDEMKEKSNLSDGSQLLDDLDYQRNKNSPEGRKLKSKNSKEKQFGRHHSSKESTVRFPIISKLLAEQMLLYWRENYHASFEKRGRWVYSTELLEKEEMLEQYGVFSEGLKRTRHLEKLNLSGGDIPAYLLMEIAEALTINRSIKELDLSGSRLSSFGLSYLFSKLAKNKSVSILKLSNNSRLDFEAVQDLVELLLSKESRLKSIDFSDCNIPDNALALLCNAFGLANGLQSLNLSLIHFSSSSLLALSSGIANTRSLLQLDISYSDISSAALRLITENLPFFGVHSIQILNLAGNRIASDKELMRFLEKMKSLKELDLSYNNLSSIATIFPPRLDKTLEVLKLRGNQIEEIPEEMLSNLKSLDLSNNRLYFKGANKIAKKLRQVPNPKWTHLKLDHNYIESEGFNDIIYALRDNQTLQSLSIAYNQLDGESVLCMIVNYDALYLQTLDITGNQIHYSIVFVFLKQMKQCRLRKLSFCDLDNDTKGEGQHECKFALNCEDLQELDFSGNEYISCTVVYSLQTRFNKIETLSLRGCTPFHDQDLINLAAYIKKSECLRQLNLRSLNLGTLLLSSIEELAAVLRQNNKLQWLDLSSNKLAHNDTTLEILLPSLGKCSNLETLDLSLNRITQRNRYPLQRLLIKSKNLKKLSLAQNLITLESLLSLDLEDQWELFFKNSNLQKLRKQSLAVTTTMGNANNLGFYKSSLFMQPSSMNFAFPNVADDKKEEGNNNTINNPQTRREEEVFIRKLEDRKREFLREHRKAFRRSLGEGSGSSLMRLKLHQLDGSGMKLRSEDLGVLGQLLSEGECLRELDLSSNLLFGKSNKVAESLLCGEPLQSLTLQHQRFRACDNFASIFFTHSSSSQTSYHSKSTGYSTAQTLPPTYSPANQNKSVFQAHSLNTNTNSASFFQAKTNQSQFAAIPPGISSISQQGGISGLQHGYSQIIVQPTTAQQQSQSQQCQLAGSFGQIPSTSPQQQPVQTIKFHTSKTIQISQVNQFKQSQIQIANATANSTKNKKSVEQILLRGCVFDQISFENLLLSFKTLLNAGSLKVFEAENIVVPVFYLADMLSILKNCANLEILKLRKLMFDDSFCVQLEQLLTTTSSLKLLDLSRNSFDDNQLSLLVQGIKNNRTLHNVVMEKLKVKQSFFPPFFDALASLQTLKLLDLAHNALSYEVFQALAMLLSSSKKLKFVNIAYHRSYEQEQAAVQKNRLKKKRSYKKGQFDNQDDDEDEDEEEEEEYIFENNQNKVQIGGISQIEEQNQEDQERKSINDSEKVVELNHNQGDNYQQDEQIQRQQGGIKNIDTEKLALNIDLIGMQPRFNIFNNENNTLNVKEDTSQKQSTDPQNNTSIKKKHNNLLGTPIKKVRRKKSYDTKEESRKRDIISQNLHQIRERVYIQHWIEMESFVVLCDRIRNPNSLRHLDLSGCGLSHDHFQVLVDALCSPDCQLKSLNIPSNKILDSSHQQLYTLIANNNCLQELNLAFCSLNQLAYKAIAAGLAKGKGLRCLDVSDNEGGDAFCEAICLAQRQILAEAVGSEEKDKEARGKLQFLFVSGMKIGAVGNRYLKEILKNASRLFISNDWEEVDDELAEQILSSYQEVFAKHNFIPHMIPSYLKRLSITNSEISDAFCSRLARRFYEFEFLEVIDLSNNRCMTSIGKISLFLHLFDIRFDNSKLKAFTINIDQERDVNFKKNRNKTGLNETNPAIIDGRSQVAIINQDPNAIINKESPKQQQPQQQDSAFSKWKSFYSLSLVDTGVLCSVVSALPTDLSFFQKIVSGAMSSKKLLPPKFQLNQTLYAKLERRQAPWTVTVGLIMHFFVWIVQWSLPPLYLWGAVDIYEDALHRIIIGVIALLSFLLTTYELIAVCSDRRRSNLLLQNEELYQKYWRSWMNKREISLCFISFMERFDGITDAVISGLFYQTQHDSLTVFTLVFIGLKSLRRIWNAVVYSFKMKSISGKEEVSGFMQVCWKLLLTQGFYAADNYINKFSPSDSVRVLFSRVYINFKSAFHLYMLTFEVLISLILNIIYLAYADPNRDTTTAAESIALYSVGKHFIQFLFHLFVFLLFKPSQIGQNHFDEAIIALRYRKALERFDRDQPLHKPPTLLSAAAARPSNFSNFRSLLNPSSFRYDFGTKNKHLDQIPANHPYHPGTHEDNHNAGTDEETFQEKYSDGLLKKNKHTFSTNKRGRRESSSDDDDEEDNDNDGSQDRLKCKEEEGQRKDESVSVSSIVEDNGPSVRLPHSIFNEPKFINNLYVLNQRHCKASP